MGNASKDAKEQKKNEQKQQAKAYEKYVKKFTPSPKYFSNSVKAFIVGGSICVAASYTQEMLMARGFEKTEAGSIVTVLLICTAQLITGFGWFDTIAKFAGAGVIVPITGFANSMVAPAMEFKKEGPVLGSGAKLFTLAGPVLVCGISASVIIGIIIYLL
ncbi:MAG: SpoVA/SpoVAEb family sporulation membrane protein [Clostridiales bacterium]|nr:SpoVA/SpoVAEb family sporulation membrane protein [Clostridiales bacterium]